MRSLLLAVLALVCSGPTFAQCGPTGVVVTVSPTNASLGQTVQVTIANNSSSVIQLPSSCVIKTKQNTFVLLSLRLIRVFVNMYY